MKTHISFVERLAGVVVSMALMLVGFIFLALGVTFLPLIGILIAVPVFLLAMHFLVPGASIASSTEESPTKEKRREIRPMPPVLRPREVG